MNDSMKARLRKLESAASEKGFGITSYGPKRAPKFMVWKHFNKLYPVRKGEAKGINELERLMTRLLENS